MHFRMRRVDVGHPCCSIQPLPLCFLPGVQAMESFSDTLMDHYVSPRHRGSLEAPSALGRTSLNGQPPYVVLYLRLQDQFVEMASFQAEGCGVTIAACSAMTELVIGQTIEECRKLSIDTIDRYLDGVPAHKHYCLSIALAALQSALEQLP